MRHLRLRFLRDCVEKGTPFLWGWDAIADDQGRRNTQYSMMRGLSPDIQGKGTWLRHSQRAMGTLPNIHRPAVSRLRHPHRGCNPHHIGRIFGSPSYSSLDCVYQRLFGTIFDAC